MTMTDPIADMLSRVRNANHAHHDSVSMPSSKLKVNIAKILKSEGYIADYTVDDAKVGKTLTLELKYSPTRERACGCMQNPITCQGCSVVWVWQSSPRPRVY